MNKLRRSQIAKVIAKIEEAKSALESIRDDEQDYFDNMPEGLQCSARGEAAEEAVDLMDEAIDSLDDVVDNLNEAMN